jgi:hypothetical protein
MPKKGTSPNFFEDLLGGITMTPQFVKVQEIKDTP